MVRDGANGGGSTGEVSSLPGLTVLKDMLRIKYRMSLTAVYLFLYDRSQQRHGIELAGIWKYQCLLAGCKHMSRPGYAIVQNNNTVE